ncbi:MAG: ABC transporter permease subunit [Spirochaetaceae bacterium]|nr:ABC transporter permease subunit [Myxococcales bacterium]MCB9725468.1 ABC transporter permease subunit [Spirochaetaceae bacterium]
MNAEQLSNQLAHFPVYFAHHVLLTVAALLLGIVFSLPLAGWAIRRPAFAAPMLGIASVVQTIPGLALLALMVPLLGRIGVVPALLALVLYSMLPVLRNAVTGALGVDPDVIEAARGIGMTDSQILLRVRFPLATPVIVAGIRTAAVWTVGMATLSTPVGATSLGNYIFSGLQTQNTVAILLGCSGAAVLAIVLDGLIRLAELSALRRDARLAALSLTLFVAGVALALAPLVAETLSHANRPRVVVGAKTFTEQYILAALIADRLEAAGFEVGIRDGLGSTVIFDALRNDEIDVYVDYSGTIWANHLGRTETRPSDVVLDEIRGWLRREHGIVTLGALGFENAYAIAMTRERAAELSIETLSDLAARSPELSIGGDYEFFARPEWLAVRGRYAMQFREERSFDSTLMYAAVSQGHVDAISAFSTDGRIPAYGLVVLDDPLSVLPPYDAVLLLSASAARRPSLVAALEPLLGQIDDETMREANRSVDLDGRSPAVIGRSLSRRLPSPGP